MKSYIKTQPLLKVLFIFCLIFATSCENTEEDIITELEESKEESDITQGNKFCNLIIGEWQFYDGTFFKMLGDENNKITHKKIYFTENGNYSESNFKDDTENNIKGNYKLIGDEILLNDWYGEPIDETFKIVSISETKLVLSNKYNEISTYIRKSTKNYEKLIVGEWNYSSYYYKFFKSSLRIEKRGGISTTVYYDWDITGDTLYLINNRTGKIKSEHTIKYCNDIYLNFNGVALKRLSHY